MWFYLDEKKDSVRNIIWNKGQFIMAWDTINQEDIKSQILIHLIIELQNSPKQKLVAKQKILMDFNVFSVTDKLSRERNIKI